MTVNFPPLQVLGSPYVRVKGLNQVNPDCFNQIRCDLQQKQSPCAQDVDQEGRNTKGKMRGDQNQERFDQWLFILGKVKWTRKQDGSEDLSKKQNSKHRGHICAEMNINDSTECKQDVLEH